MNFYTIHLPVMPRASFRILLVMKLTFFLILASLLQVHALTYGQKITLSTSNAPLMDVLRQIKTQSSYDFVIPNNLVQKAKKVTLSISNMELKEALDKCFEDQPLIYTLESRTIVVKEKEKSIFDKFKQALSLPITISGKVTDVQGNPLPGASVRIKGRTRGAITNANGEFILVSIPDSSSLVVSMIGFKTKEVSATEKLTIIMEPDAAILEQVTVSTGYQEIPKERATGSFVLLDSATLNRRISTNITDRLEGVASGLVFNKGAETAITIRGTSTLFANPSPLYVVDNFPYSGDINNINPNSIESITILKDAAAASIWGVQAGNGVIVITTKKGRYNQKLRMDFNTNITIGDKPDFSYDRRFINSADYIGMERYMFEKGYYDNDLSTSTNYRALTPVVELLNRQRNGEITDAQAAEQIDELKSQDVRNDFSKYVYRKRVNQQFALNINGGSNNNAFSLSLAYDKNAEELIRNDYSRISVNALNTYRPLKKLEVTAGLMYTSSNAKDNTSQNAYGTLNVGTGWNSSFLYPYARLADDQGNSLPIAHDYRSGYVDTAENQGFRDWKYRPLDEIKNSDNKTKVEDLVFRAAAKYTIAAFIDIQMQYQHEEQNTNARNYYNEQTYYTRNNINRYAQLDASGNWTYPFPEGSVLQLNYSKLKADFLRTHINANKHFGPDHELTAMAGAEIRETKTEGFSRGFYGYNPEYGTSNSALDFKTEYLLNPGGNVSAVLPELNSSAYSGTTNRNISYFANASYSYKQKYALYASARQDGANLFGVKTNQKVVPLWAIGTGWDIQKENFYRLEWLPRLKLRASYGFNGNVYSGTAYLIARYVTSALTGLSTAYIASAPNPQLRWEKVKNINIGLDFGILNERINGSIELYQKKGMDLIEDAPLAPSTGFTSFRGNAAETKTDGIDLTVNLHNVKGRFNWYSTLLFSNLKDKVIKFDAAFLATDLVNNANGGSIIAYPGRPLYGVYSYEWAGLDPQNGDPQGKVDGEISKDYSTIINNKDGLVFHGSARPNTYGSVRNTFSFSNISISANLTYKFRYFLRQKSVSLNYTEAIDDPHTDYTKRWQKPGDELTTSVPALVYDYDGNRNSFYRFSSALIQKGDHIRVQDITIDYNIDKKLWPKMPFSGLKIYGYLNNVGIIWKANKVGLDPDYFLSRYVAPRTLAFGIKASL